jgi:DNA-binding MarR family transcriptional regulator
LNDLNWEKIARGTLHPIQLRVLERAARAPDERFSPKELADHLGEGLPNVAYHVRQLAEQGWLKKAGTTPVRGALQHHFKISPTVLR